ncbi:soluble pyridine nucleotide transhydrogenase [Methylophaga lonarensis MPL]|uniref:Soluble pyridine nucleotide transhydrogenase n=1 Tax=Methylophaga lonarensis MPL TaxID=1286106 RepID=M7PNI1_9GAMM|nr:Si-specific NAD(P)(+) transhydrogenase [Methylophaga lonarensis]EMR12029.1 soluble pyridine nucleotide transhydrogenase [Methylophaga lonarensis MPL]
MSEYDYDFIVIGSGPAGQKSAIQAAKAGKSVAIIEQDSMFGGACVHKGTIPSKTLRENALRVKNMRQTAALAKFSLDENTEMVTLIDRLDEVLKSHHTYMLEQITRNHVVRLHARARFVDRYSLALTHVDGSLQTIRAPHIIIATGSYPRNPDNVPIDHEHILDSDSILSMLYLPSSLTVLGGGVIASEYASIFQALGVQVTMIDRYPNPLGFLDKDMTDTFVRAFEAMGGTWLGSEQVSKVYWDGISQVVTECESGRVVTSQKLLCAAGRLANVDHLDLENAGLSVNERGLISVNERLQTAVDNIYAAGDVIGSPSLASASMEQGRRATCNILGLETAQFSHLIPAGIYSIPELSSVGLTEQQARQQDADILVGIAHFSEVARGQISGNTEGMLKIVADRSGREILGIMCVGEGATELIHTGQMAMLKGAEVDIFVENTFNFPTLAEAYRIAALDILSQRPRDTRLSV